MVNLGLTLILCCLVIQFRKLSILSPIACSLVLLGSMKSLADCSALEVNFLASVDCQSRTPMTMMRAVFMNGGVNKSEVIIERKVLVTSL